MDDGPLDGFDEAVGQTEMDGCEVGWDDGWVEGSMLGLAEGVLLGAELVLGAELMVG